MRAPTVVLWDIDGTLLRSAGIGVRAFAVAVEQITGVAWAPRRLDFGGRTDRDIASLILADMGIADPELVAPVLVALPGAYETMADDLRASVRVLPGVAATLAALAAQGAFQTVVTGNVRPVAAMKVAAGDLGEHLRLDVGGYGSDTHSVRADLVRLALDRLAAAGTVAATSDVWVVGDTPRDLECAHANGIRCALVATGTYGPDELRGLGADLVLDDLSDAEPLFQAFVDR